MSVVAWAVLAGLGLGCAPKQGLEASPELEAVYVAQQSPLAPRLCLSPVAEAGRLRGEGPARWQQVASRLAAGEVAAAREALAAADADHPSTEALRGALLYQEGDISGARGVYRDLANAWPGDACVQQTAATIYMQAREPDMARALATDAWRLAPGEPEVLYTYALVWMQAGEESRAMGALRQVAEAQPSHPGAGYLLGVDSLGRGHHDLAIPALEAARAGGIDVTSPLAEAYFAGGRTLEYVTLASAAGWPMGDGGAIARAEAPAAAWREALGLPAEPDAQASSLYATFETSMGAVRCRLLWQEAPLTVGNFVGLATGRQPWTDPRTGQPQVGVPLYDGTIFHRVIPGFMVQGGDPLGTGTGGPGYQFHDELAPDQRFEQPGLLAMANAGPDSNGSQFFITDGPAPHLRGRHTVFGVCQDLGVVSAIARVPVGDQDRPRQEVRLERVRIEARPE